MRYPCCRGDGYRFAQRHPTGLSWNCKRALPANRAQGPLPWEWRGWGSVGADLIREPRRNIRSSRTRSAPTWEECRASRLPVGLRPRLDSPATPAPRWHEQPPLPLAGEGWGEGALKPRHPENAISPNNGLPPHRGALRRMGLVCDTHAVALMGIASLNTILRKAMPAHAPGRRPRVEIPHPV